jgi:mRNA interferase RelE/StbE
MYRVRFTPKAWKEVESLPRPVAHRLVKKAESLADDPRPTGVKKLSGSPARYRIRAGDYRIIYRIEDDVLLVLVVAIGDRRDVYRK